MLNAANSTRITEKVDLIPNKNIPMSFARQQKGVALLDHAFCLCLFDGPDRRTFYPLIYRLRFWIENAVPKLESPSPLSQ